MNALLRNPYTWSNHNQSAETFDLAVLMLDIGDGWTSSRLLPKSKALSESSRSQIPERWARATSPPPIEGTTNCSRIALGFACGSGMAFVAGRSRQ
jgi:hypothetical protein